MEILGAKEHAIHTIPAAPAARSMSLIPWSGAVGGVQDLGRPPLEAVMAGRTMFFVLQVGVRVGRLGRPLVTTKQGVTVSR